MLQTLLHRVTNGSGDSLIYLESSSTMLRSRGFGEEGNQSLTRVILGPISQILVNVTLKLVDACRHNCTSRKSIPTIKVLSFE